MKIEMSTEMNTEMIESLIPELTQGTVIVELTEHERLVLDALHQDATTTIRDMVACLGISKSSVSRALKGLQEKQVIERMGSTKKGSWKIKA